HHLTQRIISCLGDFIEQTGKTQARCWAAYPGYLILRPPIGIVQLKDEFVIIGHIRGEKPITPLNPRSVQVQRNRIAEGIWCRQSFAERYGQELITAAPDFP